MIVQKNDRVLVQGLTGKQGTFWAERMMEYGTQIMGGVNPRKAGTEHIGLPVYGTAQDAMADKGFEVAVMFIPPLGAKAAAMDAIEAGVKKIVCLTEHIPVQDVMYFLAAADEAGCQVIGPNTTGVVTTGENFVGFMPAFNERILRPGRVGVISRSGSLGTFICMKMVEAGFGISAFIGIGGDPIIGTTTLQALKQLDAHDGTDQVVIVGEIGGTMEEEAAEYAASMNKPMVAFVAGAASPPGKKMGHAGAIVVGDKGTYASKKAAFEAAGVQVLDSPSMAGDAMRAIVG
jgi:succinyl-CoA synthetase alpha subunit